MKLKFLAPVLTFAAIAVILWYALFNLNPTEIPSELVSKPAPAFSLEPVPGYGPGLAQADLATGKVTLLNVFASYARTGMDLKGRVGIDFGVYGVPETFVISADGKILDKIIGPVSKDMFDMRIRPLLNEAGS